MDVASILLCQKCGKSRSGPKFLQCSHTICKQCLKSDTKSSSCTPATQCPVCGREIAKAAHEDNGSFYQHLNTCLVEVSEVLGNRLFEEETTCCICRLQHVTSQTTHQCLDCGDTLCEMCQRGHTSSSATYTHKTVEIGEIRTGKYKVKVPINLPCHEHGGKKHEFYCDTCRTPLCAMCLIVKHIGTSHRVISLDEATERCRSRLQDLTGTTEEKLKVQNSVIRNSFTRYRQTIDRTQESSISAVRKKTQGYIDRILKEEQTVVEEIRTLCNRRRADLDLKDNNLTQVLQTVVKGVQLSKALLEEGTLDEVIMVFEDMVKMLDSSNVSISLDNVARYVGELKTPVYTVEYNFPDSQSSMFTLHESLLDSPMESSVRAPVIAVQKNTNNIIKHTLSPCPLDVNNTQASMQVSTLCISESDKTGKASDSTERMVDVVKNKESDNLLFQTDDTTEADSDGTSEEGVFKVTESLSIVGELGRSLSLNESTTSEENPPDEVSLRDGSSSSSSDLPSTSDVFPDVIPGPYDCNVVPPRKFPSSFSITGFAGVKNKPNQSSVSSPSQKNNAMCLVKKGTFSTLVARDTVKPVIVGSCGVGGNKLIILDNGNKKVRLIHESGTHGNVNRPNKLTESLSVHGVAYSGSMIVYICGTTVYITDGSLNMIRKFPLDEPDIDCKESVSLPLCAYTGNSFLVGNLPDNKYRVYNTEGKKLVEKQFPIDGPVVSVSRTKEEEFLYSSWNQPGTVYQVNKSGQKVQTYRPPGSHVWYPEDTCEDSRHNVFVANPRQRQIHVFDPRGSQIYLQSVANLAFPRCLTMTSDDTLIVSGDGAILQTYRCTYYTKTGS